MYINPLTKSQERLRGVKRADMTDEQLLEWIDACNKMETIRNMPAKARRSWKRGREEALAEIEKRKNRKKIINLPPHQQLLAKRQSMTSRPAHRRWARQMHDPLSNRIKYFA
jgi:hypothetical protein